MASRDSLILRTDPARDWREALDAGLVGRSQEPLNCETPPPLLDGDVTPTSRFFRRNHFPIPDLDASAWRLEIGGLVRRPLILTFDELQQFEPQSLAAVLECAGNGRTLFSPAVTGERWDLGAVGNATWTGARLADVLELAGVRPEAVEVIFRGADQGTIEDSPETIAFERSLRAGEVAVSGALLAYEMNGDPLHPRHGYPVRLIVPGSYAVTAVKWLTSITVTDRPFDGFFQTQHYVYEWPRDGHAVREPVGRQRVRALITEPAGGDVLRCGAVTVRGIAWSGDAPVTRVEVSLDGGTWQNATLTGEPGLYGWQRWELAVRAQSAGQRSIRARATDGAGHVQPEQPEWNRLGYGGNFIHEVKVQLRD
jgi:DMSO/TMAO reductase YedYZ molybdopterin-dependent catalytic subunit